MKHAPAAFPAVGACFERRGHLGIPFRPAQEQFRSGLSGLDLPGRQSCRLAGNGFLFPS